MSNGLGSGGGHGGRGGKGCYDDTCVNGGISYGSANLPCELGSGSGNDSLEISTAGGGTLGNRFFWLIKHCFLNYSFMMLPSYSVFV